MRKYGAMSDLSDELLVETYYKAKELKLADDFLSLILEEMNRREFYDKKISL